MVCRWTLPDVTWLAQFSVVYDFVSRSKIKTTEVQLGGLLWLKIIHCDWPSDLMTSKQTKNLKMGGPLFPFSTLIWKNTSFIWSILAWLCDVIGPPNYHHQKSFLIKLQPCSLQSSVLWKSGAYVTLSCRSTESSDIFKGKCLWWRFFFFKDANLEFIPAISLKTDSNTEIFEYGFFMVTLFKLSRNFLWDIFAKHFLIKSQASNL